MKAVTSQWQCAAYLCLVFCLLLPERAQSVEPTVVPRPRLQGTFLQLLSGNGDWTTEKWAELFGNFRELGLSQLVVQWTVHDRIAFYPAAKMPTVANPPLETILQMADEAKIHVLVGLVYDPGYWKAVSGGPAGVDPYLRGILLRSASLAEELAPLVQRHPSFKGWYIVQEVNEATWSTPEAQRALFTYLRNLSSFLHLLTRGARVAVSGFSSQRSDPKSLQAFWTTLLREAPAIDLVLFQDGIGAGKLDLTNLPLYLGAIREATNANARELRTIVEIFRQIGDPSVDGGEFRAVPASLDRILSQLTVAAPFSVNTLAFSVPEYMSSLGGPAAIDLFQAYLAEMRRATFLWPSCPMHRNGD